MKGLLADVNTQKHIYYLRFSLMAQGLDSVLEVEGMTFRTFLDLGLDPHPSDRPLWQFCQAEGWVLFTDDRNDDGRDSLQATMNDSWEIGLLPVLTPSRKQRLEADRGYCDRVAFDVADLLLEIASGGSRDQPRIYVPLNS